VQWSRSFPFLFLVICMAGLIVPAWADIQSVVLYKTDFSENPGWMTNSPSRYYWDSDREMYHFRTEGGTNGYAYVPLRYDDQSFTLDYDVIVLVSQPNSAFRFGLTSSEMDFTRGTTILSALENGKYGKLFTLRVIDQNNQLREISSYCFLLWKPDGMRHGRVPGEYHVPRNGAIQQGTPQCRHQGRSEGYRRSRLWLLCPRGKGTALHGPAGNNDEGRLPPGIIFRGLYR